MSKCVYPSRPPSCGKPSFPCSGPQYLLPRVIASSREHLRCYEAFLPLPSCENIRALRSLEAGPEPPEVIASACGCTLKIPLTACVITCGGCSRSFLTFLEIPCRKPGGGDGGANFVSQASVRLIEAGCPCGDQIPVTVEVWADLYKIRFQPCQPSFPQECAPACPPPLPWYPQPRY